MKFNMTTPCGNCPFLRTSKAIRLTRERVEEIAGMMLDSQGGVFPCHKTTVEGEDDEGGCDLVDGPNTLHCAGALIFAEKNGTATQMMRIAERFNHDGNGYDPRKLNTEADVFNSVEEMLETALDKKRKRRR